MVRKSRWFRIFENRKQYACLKISEKQSLITPGKKSWSYKAVDFEMKMPCIYIHPFIFFILSMIFKK